MVVSSLSSVSSSIASSIPGYQRTTSGFGGIALYPFQGYEIDANGVITKFIRVGGESIASNKGTSKYFYHNDHLGSVNVVTDINGTRVQLNEYDPWGAVSRSEGSIDPDQRFTGQKLDPETGLYYYGGRYYDAEIGRFISADPFVQTIFDPQNLNRYSYVVNNPQNYTDPSGYFHKLVKKKHHGFSFFGTIFGFIFGGPIGAILGALNDFVPAVRTAFRVLGIIGGIAMALNGHPEGLLYAASGALAFGKGSGFQYASMALGAAATRRRLVGTGPEEVAGVVAAEMIFRAADLAG